MKNQIKKGYTLVELLVCLIIIALIIGAFAPIITKRLSNNKVSILGVESSSTDIEDIFLTFDDSENSEGPYHKCESVKDLNGVQTLKCTLKNINASKINALITGAGGGGAGATFWGEAGRVVKHFPPETSLPVDSSIHNAQIHIFGQGASGSRAFYAETYIEDKTYIDSCPSNTTEVVLSADKSKYCVTNYNIRPKNLNEYENYSLENFSIIPKAVNVEQATMVDIALNQEGVAGVPKCRIAPENSCSITDTYPGCGRTVCNEQAASIMCSELDLGGNSCKDEEGNLISCKGKWGLIDKNITIPSLCTKTKVSDDIPYCTMLNMDNACYGSTYVWGYNSNFNCYSGTKYASVRCALLKTSTKKVYNTSSGAGGSSGGYLHTSVQNVIDYCVNNNFNCTFYGGTTYVSIKDSYGATNFSRSFYVSYHSGATNATENTYGTAATKALDNCCSGSTCSNGGAATAIYCSLQGGSAGNLGKNGKFSQTHLTDVFTPVEGGKGGDGRQFENSGVVYGKGGDGGSVTREKPTTAELAGEPGGAGHTVLVYDSFYNGAPGGGGGGGGFAMIKDIAITPNAAYEIQIGGGGKGGAESENGINGGDTVVTFDSKTYRAFGGKGGKTGVPATNLSKERQVGIGGEGGGLEGVSSSAGVGSSQNGQRGTNGMFQDDYSDIGGLGGRSGISMSVDIVYAACGGMYFDNNISCLNQGNHHGLGKEYLDSLVKKPSHIYKENNLGSFGGGGGGGGWQYISDEVGADTSKGLLKGTGGKGQGGYVYIWWQRR